MSSYYLMYIIIYSLLTWLWYVLLGMNLEMEINLFIAFLGLSVPSFLPEIIVRCIGILYENKKVKIKAVCEEMRVYAMLGNMFLIGAIYNSYEKNPTVLMFLGFTLLGFFISYLPMLGLWSLYDRIASCIKSEKNIERYFSDSKNLGSLLGILRDCCCFCQEYPGATGIMFLNWGRYGTLTGIMLAIYWNKQEMKWVREFYNRVVNGRDSSVYGKALVRLIDNTRLLDIDDNFEVRQFFIVECMEEVVGNKFINKIYTLLQRFCKKYPELKMSISLDKTRRSISQCRRITIRYD